MVESFDKLHPVVSLIIHLRCHALQYWRARARPTLLYMYTSRYETPTNTENILTQGFPLCRGGQAFVLFPTPHACNTWIQNEAHPYVWVRGGGSTAAYAWRGPFNLCPLPEELPTALWRSGVLLLPPLAAAAKWRVKTGQKKVDVQRVKLQDLTWD